MKKMDLKKELKHLYQQSAKEVVQVDVPIMNYVMMDGEGDPNTSQAFSDAVEALFAVSYAVKFMVKKGPLGIDYGVMSLEGLWWVDDMSTFSTEDKSNWKWTVMIMQPDFVTKEMIESAMSEVKKRRTLLPSKNCVSRRFQRGKARRFFTSVHSQKKGLPLRKCIGLSMSEANESESITKST